MMWVKIAVVFILQAPLGAVPAHDPDINYNMYRDKVEEEMESPGTRSGLLAVQGSADNATMRHVDKQAIEGVIQKLLRVGDSQAYVFPTSPTRSPAPLARDVTRSSYTELLSQLVKHASSINAKETYPPETSEDTGSTEKLLEPKGLRDYVGQTSPTSPPGPSTLAEETDVMEGATESHPQVIDTGPTEKPLEAKDRKNFVGPTSPTSAPGPSTLAEETEVMEGATESHTQVVGAIQKVSGVEEFPELVASITATRTPEHSTLAEETQISRNVTRSSYTQLIGAIQKFLGVEGLPEYAALTSPEWSVGPSTMAETVARAATRSSYTKLIGQLVDYVNSLERTQEYTETTSEGQLQPALALTAPFAESQLDVEALRQKKQRQRKRTRTTRRSTRNTLCTDSARYCRTMCFDEEKYRISCNTTEGPPTSPRMDVSKFLFMLSSLVQDYDTNLTEQMNETLVKMGYQQCPTTTTETTTTEATTPTPDDRYYDYEVNNLTGAVISKCFVCGLENENIPREAHCSDAFSTDVLPLNPVDASARGHLLTFRKYCKYMDMDHWHINGSDSRTIWGRWTGGCAVRWVDLSGVYTQRTCRNKYRPSLGHHFVSKRMARLELALLKVDNGCIISPMASLVPFSRGISLYARFHACVCTGNYCNRAEVVHTAMTTIILFIVELIKILV